MNSENKLQSRYASSPFPAPPGTKSSTSVTFPLHNNNFTKAFLGLTCPRYDVVPLAPDPFTQGNFARISKITTRTNILIFLKGVPSPMVDIAYYFIHFLPPPGPFLYKNVFIANTNAACRCWAACDRPASRIRNLNLATQPITRSMHQSSLTWIAQSDRGPHTNCGWSGD